ncbi:MAG: amidohydrolase family protein [Byssovorax sp.]
MRFDSHSCGRLVSLGLLASISLLAPAAAASPPARTILHHGQIFTGAPGGGFAEAISIEGDHVVAVGSSAALLAHPKAGTQLVDLGGRTVIPGLNDAHVHVVIPHGTYVNSPAFLPGPGPTLAEIEASIAAGAAATPPGTWLFGFVGTSVFDDDQANRFSLDTVSPDHPVALFAWTGHGTWLNTRALETLAIAEDEPDPFAGHYERVPGTAILTGEVHEYAEFGVRRKLLSFLPDADLVGQYQTFASDAVRFGFTSLQDMAVGLTRQRAVATLRAAHLPLRVRSMCFPLTPSESCEVSNDGHDHDHDDDGLLSVSGVKWVTDGTPVERLAFVETPYADRPGWIGAPDLPDAALHAMLEQHKHGPLPGNQMLFHSVGDAAIHQVLDAMEDTGTPASWRGRRTRIEHGDLLFPPDFDRAHDLGIVIVQNATHLALTPVFAQRCTPAVFAELEPLRSLLDEGIPLALGTDGIGAVSNPFVDLLLATIHPTRPSEALTIEQAVRAYTRGSAYAEFEEGHKGTLEAGQLADLAVLSQDIFHAPPPAIPGTVSVLTMVNGVIVWTSGAVTTTP